MTNNTPSGAKKHCESTEPASHQTAIIFFFLLLLLSWLRVVKQSHELAVMDVAKLNNMAVQASSKLCHVCV